MHAIVNLLHCSSKTLEIPNILSVLEHIGENWQPCLSPNIVVIFK